MATKTAVKGKKGQRPGSMHIDKRAARLLDDPISDGPDDELLTTEEVADWLKVSRQSLEIARSRGTGPRFVTISPRRIRYRRGDVKAWLKSRSHLSTAEYAKRAAR
jgi:predicted DNA-binding transcriptional regulator AlpA